MNFTAALRFYFGFSPINFEPVTIEPWRMMSMAHVSFNRNG
jgi:hypothetical protein